MMMFNYEENRYPFYREEQIGIYGSMRCYLIDPLDGAVVAFWDEIANGEVMESDSYSDTSKDVEPLSIYVSNLNPKTTQDDLIRHFMPVGELFRVTLLIRKKKNNTSSAFIKFNDIGSVERAIFLNGSRLKGYEISVEEKLLTDIKTEDPELDPLSVYIGNLDHGITSLDLASYLGTMAGEVEKVTILKNKNSGRNKGAAYVQFKEEYAMKKALSLNGMFIGGKCVKVKRKRRSQSSDETNNNKKIKMEMVLEEDACVSDKDNIFEENSIFIGNLEIGISKSDLWNHFKECGAIENVVIHKSNRTAHIEFMEKESVEHALYMNGSKLKNVTLRVQRKKTRVKVKKEVDLDVD